MIKLNPIEQISDDESFGYICAHCGAIFDNNNAGHYDDATGMAFCCQECECNYDQTTGLPAEYIRCNN